MGTPTDRHGIRRSASATSFAVESVGAARALTGRSALRSSLGGRSARGNPILQAADTADIAVTGALEDRLSHPCPDTRSAVHVDRRAFGYRGQLTGLHRRHVEVGGPLGVAGGELGGRADVDQSRAPCCHISDRACRSRWLCDGGL